MALPYLISKKNVVINLIGFFAACLVMWFGVFVMHLYDAMGTKQTLGKFILSLDWLLVAFFGLSLLYISIRKRKTELYKTLPVPMKVASYLASSLVILGLCALLAVVVFYILLLLIFWHFSF